MDPLLSAAEREAFLDAYDQYFVCRTKIQNAGGVLGPYCKAERSTFSTYKNYIAKDRDNVERQNAIRMVNNIKGVLQAVSDRDILKLKPNWPRDVCDQINLMPGVAIMCFAGAKHAAPSIALCRDISSEFSELRDLVDQVHAKLLRGLTVEPASPVARALVTSGQRVPAAQAKLPDLAQMQFGRAPGANRAGSDEIAYKVSVKIGEQPDHVGGVDVLFGVRTFQITLSCAEAVPSLAWGLNTLNFYGEGKARRAKVSDDYQTGSLLRERTYRIEAQDGPEVLVGHSDQETLFIVAGEPLFGDRAVLEIRPFNLKVRPKDPAAMLEENDREGRRMVDNWLRAQLYQGATLPLAIELCRQELVS